MKHSKWLRISALSLAAMLLHFCSANPLEPDTTSVISMEKGIPTDQINWVSWNPEVQAEIETANAGNLAKRKTRGFASKRLLKHVGGTVGGARTFNNSVDVPEFAFEENGLTVSVNVLNVDYSGQTAAGVEFLPSREYDADVFITLSWSFLDVDETELENLDLSPYFSEDGGSTWFAVDEYDVDQDERTITFEIDHFTQYGWGLDEDD